MLSKHMKVAPGGKKVNNQGKGSTQQPLSADNNVVDSGSSSPNATIGNYAKATPMSNPTPPVTDGLGSGTWPGIGQ